jgi:hypothetical protein
MPMIKPAKVIILARWGRVGHAYNPSSHWAGTEASGSRVQD